MTSAFARSIRPLLSAAIVAGSRARLSANSSSRPAERRVSARRTASSSSACSVTCRLPLAARRRESPPVAARSPAAVRVSEQSGELIGRRAGYPGRDLPGQDRLLLCGLFGGNRGIPRVVGHELTSLGPLDDRSVYKVRLSYRIPVTYVGRLARQSSR